MSRQSSRCWPDETGAVLVASDDAVSSVAVTKGCSIRFDDQDDPAPKTQQGTVPDVGRPIETWPSTTGFSPKPHDAIASCRRPASRGRWSLTPSAGTAIAPLCATDRRHRGKCNGSDMTRETLRSETTRGHATRGSFESRPLGVPPDYDVVVRQFDSETCSCLGPEATALETQQDAASQRLSGRGRGWVESGWYNFQV